MSQELNQVKINKISKALYDENVANGTITPTMQEQEVWIFTDDEVYTSAEKTKLNGIEAGAQVNPTKLSELSNDVNFITNSVNNLTNYYTKTNTYTKTEVNDLINGITSMNVAVVQTLPTSGSYVTVNKDLLPSKYRPQKTTRGGAMGASMRPCGFEVNVDGTIKLGSNLTTMPSWIAFCVTYPI